MSTNHFLAALGAALALAGCGGKNASDQEPTARTNVSTAEVKMEIREAVDTSKAYAAQGKDQFVEAMSRKLTDADQKMSELGKRIETLDAGAKAEANKVMASWREARIRLGQKFDEFKKSGLEIGQDVKAGFESAEAELEKAYENLKAKFKE